MPFLLKPDSPKPSLYTVNKETVVGKIPNYHDIRTANSCQAQKCVGYCRSLSTYVTQFVKRTSTQTVWAALIIDCNPPNIADFISGSLSLEYLNRLSSTPREVRRTRQSFWYMDQDGLLHSGIQLLLIGHAGVTCHLSPLVSWHAQTSLMYLVWPSASSLLILQCFQCFPLRSFQYNPIPWLSDKGDPPSTI